MQVVKFYSGIQVTLFQKDSKLFQKVQVKIV